MKTLLVALDLSQASARVCDVACGLAESMQARLVLLHAVQPQKVALRSYGFAVGEVQAMLATLEKRATRDLLALVRRCKKRGLEVEAAQLAGEAAPTILAQAKALGADLIVLGSHGHSAAFDLLVGSTAQRVLRQAKTPVLVVPMNAPRVKR